MFLVVVGLFFLNYRVSSECVSEISTKAFNALFDLYQSTHGSHWRIWYGESDWNFSNLTTPLSINDLKRPCNVNPWVGLTCSQQVNSSECIISKINLPSRNLTGTIPNSISELKYLTDLQLSYNHIHGSLPSSFSDLSYLNYLDFEYNSLNGTVPTNFSALSKLTELYLNNNNFTGKIPLNLPSELRFLLLNSNNLTGPIPSDFSSKTALSFLDLSENNLNGSIPEKLSELPQLVSLYLFSNSLTGPIPPHWPNSSLLSSLDLSSNHLSGPISETLLQLPYLSEIMLSYNRLSRSIPSLLCHMQSLQILELVGNRLTGPIPNDLGRLTNLLCVQFCHNQLTGTLPSGLGDLIYLQNIAMDNNLLWGPLPSSLGSLLNLGNFTFQSNHLSGTIPTTLGSLTNLMTLYLNDNHFSGNIPSSLSRLTNLMSLYLYSNSLSGLIPTELSTLTLLQLIDLHSNRLSGPIPLSFRRLTRLSQLILSSNQLSGTLPPEILSLPQLEVLALGGNCFSGSLPSCEVCNYSSSLLAIAFNGLSSGVFCRQYYMTRIKNTVQSPGYLPRSFISGGVPSCLWKLPNLNTLYLAGNSLTGSLQAEPFDPRTTRLTNISLAYNQLTGTIPESVQSYAGFKLLSLTHNRLCGSLSPHIHSILPSIPKGSWRPVLGHNSKLGQSNPLPFSVHASSSSPRQNTSTIYDFSVNRFSGNLPSYLLGYASLVPKILEGNLFQFDLQDLPDQEERLVVLPNVGSMTLNMAILSVFLAIFLTLGLLFCVVIFATLKIRSLTQFVQFESSTNPGRNRQASTSCVCIGDRVRLDSEAQMNQIHDTTTSLHSDSPNSENRPFTSPLLMYFGLQSKGLYQPAASLENDEMDPHNTSLQPQHNPSSFLIRSCSCVFSCFQSLSAVCVFIGSFLSDVLQICVSLFRDMKGWISECDSDEELLFYSTSEPRTSTTSSSSSLSSGNTNCPSPSRESLLSRRSCIAKRSPSFLVIRSIRQISEVVKDLLRRLIQVGFASILISIVAPALLLLIPCQTHKPSDPDSLVHFSTHRHRFAWTLSSIFFHGFVPAAVISGAVLLVIGLFKLNKFTLITQSERKRKRKQSRLTSRFSLSSRSSDLDKDDQSILSDPSLPIQDSSFFFQSSSKRTLFGSVSSQSSSELKHSYSYSYWVYFTNISYSLLSISFWKFSFRGLQSFFMFASVILADIIVILCVNALYLLIALRNSTWSIPLQLLLALFKTLWNTLWTPWFLRFIEKHSSSSSFEQFQAFESSDSDSLLPSPSSDPLVSLHQLAQRRKRTFKRMLWLAVLMGIFNIIIAPCLATILTDRACLFPLFVQQELPPITYFTTLTSTKQMRNPDLSSNQTTIIVAHTVEIPYSSQASSYPAFVYNYQCSSQLIIAYVPVLLYSLCFSGILLPLIKLLILLAVYFELIPPTHSRSSSSATSPSTTTPSSSFNSSTSLSLRQLPPPSPTDSSDPPSEPPRNSFYCCCSRSLFLLLDSVVARFYYLPLLDGEAIDGISETKFSISPLLLQLTSTTTRVIVVYKQLMALTLLLTFGFACPFLGLVVVVSTAFESLVWMLVSGRRRTLILQTSKYFQDLHTPSSPAPSPHSKLHWVSELTESQYPSLSLCPQISNDIDVLSDSQIQEAEQEQDLVLDAILEESTTSSGDSLADRISLSLPTSLQETLPQSLTILNMNLTDPRPSEPLPPCITPPPISLRLLSDLNDLGLLDRIVEKSSWGMVCVASLFWSVQVFDMVGDVKGFVWAISSAMFVLIFFPMATCVLVEIVHFKSTGRSKLI